MTLPHVTTDPHCGCFICRGAMAQYFTAKLHARRPAGAGNYGPVSVDFKVDGAPRPLDWQEETRAAVIAAAGFGFEVAWVVTVTQREATP